MDNVMILGSFFFVAGPAQSHFGRARLWHLGGQFLILQRSLALLSSLTFWPTCPLIIITHHEYQQVLSSSPTVSTTTTYMNCASLALGVSFFWFAVPSVLSFSIFIFSSLSPVVRNQCTVRKRKKCRGS